MLLHVSLFTRFFLSLYFYRETRRSIFSSWYQKRYFSILIHGKLIDNRKKGETQIFVVAIPLSDFLYFCCCSGIPCIMLTSMKRVFTLAYRDSTCLFFFPYLFCPLSLTKTFYLNREIKRITWNHFIKRNQWFCRQKHTRHWWREKTPNKHLLVLLRHLLRDWLPFLGTLCHTKTAVKNIIACDEYHYVGFVLWPVVLQSNSESTI